MKSKKTSGKRRAAARKKTTSAAQDNAHLVREIYAAFGRGDIERVLDGLSENIEWFVPGPKEISYAGSRRGRRQVAEFFRILGETTEINPFEPREYISQGNQVAVVGYYAGHVKQTGRRFEEDWVMVWTFQNGKVVKFREYMDPTQLIKAFTAPEAVSVG